MFEVVIFVRAVPIYVDHICPIDTAHAEEDGMNEATYERQSAEMNAMRRKLDDLAALEKKVQAALDSLNNYYAEHKDIDDEGACTDQLEAVIDAIGIKSKSIGARIDEIQPRLTDYENAKERVPA